MTEAGLGNCMWQTVEVCMRQLCFGQNTLHLQMRVVPLMRNAHWHGGPAPPIPYSGGLPERSTCTFEQERDLDWIEKGAPLQLPAGQGSRCKGEPMGHWTIVAPHAA